MAEEDDSKACPFCGETIKKVAIRCKHCHAALDAGAAEPDFDRHRTAPRPVAVAPPEPTPGATPELSAGGDFDQRFLEFAYKTTVVLNAASVAYALKIPIKEAEERLEDLAARDVLIREVDHEGCVYFRLPGRAVPGGALVPRPALQPAPRAPHPNAVAGLLVNLLVPGAGSLMTGRVWEGAAQLTMLIIGFPLSFVFIGIPILVVAWGWAVATGISAMGDSAPRPPPPPPPH